MHKAIVVPASGGPEILRYEDVSLPEPGPKELLVRVAAAGVNFIDTYKRSGVYPMQYPFIPGAEAAGTVVAAGRDVATFREGARVATAEGGGTYSEYTIMEADKALPIPDGVSDEVAAALPMQGLTAHYLCNSTFPVEEGQTVLTHAGAGGVGLLLIQLLKAKGARVITTASTDAKRDLARSAGADHALAYEGFAEEVRHLTEACAQGWRLIRSLHGEHVLERDDRAWEVKRVSVLSARPMPSARDGWHAAATRFPDCFYIRPLPAKGNDADGPGIP